MKADNLSIAKVFSSGGDIHYVLPHFQREYTWEKEQWTTLLTDALGVYGEAVPQASAGTSDLTLEHFLGSIVVIHRKLPRQADSSKGDFPAVIGLGRNVSGGTRPRLS